MEFIIAPTMIIFLEIFKTMIYSVGSLSEFISYLFIREILMMVTLEMLKFKV